MASPCIVLQLAIISQPEPKGQQEAAGARIYALLAVGRPRAGRERSGELCGSSFCSRIEPSLDPFWTFQLYTDITCRVDGRVRHSCLCEVGITAGDIPCHFGYNLKSVSRPHALG